MAGFHASRLNRGWKGSGAAPKSSFSPKKTQKTRMYQAEDPVETYNRGLEHLDYNEPDLAIEAFSQTLALKPSSVHAWFARGFARASRGDLTGAIADYTEALRLDPCYTAAYQNRSAAYRQQGKTDLADQDEAHCHRLRGAAG
jgi:tetratricopeptide (TPR) repeat protein